MNTPSKYSIGRDLGSSKVRAFDLRWDGQRPVLENADDDFGPSDQERDRVLSHLAQSHTARSGGEAGGKFFESIVKSDPRTKAGFDVGVFSLPGAVGADVTADEVEVEVGKMVARVVTAMRPMLKPIGWGVVVLAWPGPGPRTARMEMIGSPAGPAAAIAALEHALAVLKRAAAGEIAGELGCPACGSANVAQAREHSDHPGVMKCADCAWLGTNTELVRVIR